MAPSPEPRSGLPLFKTRSGQSMEQPPPPPSWQKEWKNHALAMLGEFVGTWMFLFFPYAGAQTTLVPSTEAPTPPALYLLYISIAYGASLTINVWIWYRISGGLFNPCISLALLLTRVISPIRCFLLVISQLLGGIVAAASVSAMFPGTLTVTTVPSAHTSWAQAVFIEAFLTFELVFTVFMLAAEKHKATFLAPVGIGLALFVAELAAVRYTGASLNPARSFGPACVVGFDNSQWIYWVGPGLGTLVATAFYKLMKKADYTQVNPGQDRDDGEVVIAIRDERDAEEVNNHGLIGVHGGSGIGAGQGRGR